MGKIRMLAGVALAAALVGCDAGQVPGFEADPRPSTTSQPAPTVTAIAPGCSVGPQGQADRDCDPGVLNPQVRQETIHQTICVPNWTDRQRPSTSYTSKLRDAEMLLYYPPGTPPTAVRYDHLWPLELGGDRRNPLNLWPQPVDWSYVKNTHGGRLKDRVCRGELSLADAQREIWDRWTH